MLLVRLRSDQLVSYSQHALALLSKLRLYDFLCLPGRRTRFVEDMFQS